MNTAIRSHCLDQRTAGAEIKCNLLCQPPLHVHRKINADTSVDRSGFQMRRVVLRHRHHYAAIRRADIETLALPSITAEFNNQTAVRRRAVHRSTDALEHYATVQSREVDAARSEEHTSELQSRLHLVCRLLLE